MEGFDLDLFTYLYTEYSDKAPDFDMVLKLMYAVLYGTQCLHEKNIILTDIKPLNIVLNKDPFRVALIDFDSLRDATFDGSALVDESVASTEGFVSMEALRSRWLSFDNDVFAIGMTLFQIITFIDPPPLKTLEDFKYPKYQQTVKKMIKYMNQRMSRYSQTERNVIIHLFSQMTAFLPHRAKIPDLLQQIESMQPAPKEEPHDEPMGM